MVAFTISGNVGELNNAQLAGLSALLGTTSLATAVNNTTAPSTGTAPTSTTPVESDEDRITRLYFPSNPADALTPSPEDSNSIRIDGKIGHRPYLFDAVGMMVRLVDPALPVAENELNRGVQVGGRIMTVPKDWGENSIVDQIRVRNKKVYFNLRGGQWQEWRADTASLYPGSLPDTVTVGAAGPALVARPELTGKTPGTSGTVLLVGPGRTFSTLADALAASHDGDTIDVNGNYSGPQPGIKTNVLIQSSTGATFDATGVPIGQLAAGGKGLLVPQAEQCIIRGITVKGAFGDDGTGGIRADDGCRSLWVDGCTIMGNSTGVNGGAMPLILIITNTLFDGNGTGNGLTHHIYAFKSSFFSGKDNVFKNAKGGHDYKLRSLEVSINGGSVSAGSGGGANNDDGASCIDIPDGTQTPAIIQNITVDKAADAANHTLIGYCAESKNNGTAGVLLLTSKLNALCEGPSLYMADGTMTVSGCTFTGNKITSQGAGKVIGI